MASSNRVLRRWSHDMYAIDELNRFLIMSMNRKMLSEALFCAGQILRAGNGEHMMTKLLVSYCSESIGLGWAQVPIFISDQNQIWRKHTPKTKVPVWENDFLLRLVFETVAVLTLVPKNSMIGSLSICLFSYPHSRAPARPPHNVMDRNKKGFRGIRCLLKMEIDKYDEKKGALEDKNFLNGMSCANVLALLATYCSDTVRQLYRDNMWQALKGKAEKDDELLDIIDALYQLYHKKHGIHMRSLWLHANVLFKYRKSSNWAPELDKKLLSNSIRSEYIEPAILYWAKRNEADKKGESIPWQIRRPLTIPTWARDGHTIAGQGIHTLEPFQKECKSKQRNIDLSSWSEQEILKSVNTVEETKPAINAVSCRGSGQEIGKYFEVARIIDPSCIWVIEPESKTADPFFSKARECFIDRVRGKGWKLFDIRLIQNDFWTNSQWSGKAFFEQEWEFPPEHWDPIVVDKAAILTDKCKKLETLAIAKRKEASSEFEDKQGPAKRLKVELQDFKIEISGEIKDAEIKQMSKSGMGFGKPKVSKKEEDSKTSRDTWWKDNFLWRGPYSLERQLDVNKIIQQVHSCQVFGAINKKFSTPCALVTSGVFSTQDKKSAWIRMKLDDFSSVPFSKIEKIKDQNQVNLTSAGIVKLSKLGTDALTWPILKQAISHLVVKSCHGIGDSNFDSLYLNILTDKVWSVIMEDKKSKPKEKKEKAEKTEKTETKAKKSKSKIKGDVKAEIKDDDIEVDSEEKKKPKKKQEPTPEWIACLFSGNKSKFPSGSYSKAMIELINGNKQEFQKLLQELRVIVLKHDKTTPVTCIDVLLKL